MKGTNRSLTVAVVLAAFASSCSDGTGPGDQSNDRISIVNNTGALLSRVTYYPDSTVPLDATGVGYSMTPTVRAAMSGDPGDPTSGNLVLKLEAEVAPPSIGGNTLQATSVAIVGTLAVVSYNMRGAEYLGAIDVFDISKPKNPVLQSQALFQNADMNAVSTDGVHVYAAEATGDGECKPHPSNCETIHLRKGETEFFDIKDEAGEIVAQYQLDLVDIKARKTPAAVKARKSSGS
jgi:hypothetical protein